jgi:hypothetical protein
MYRSPTSSTNRRVCSCIQELSPTPRANPRGCFISLEKERTQSTPMSPRRPTTPKPAPEVPQSQTALKPPGKVRDLRGQVFGNLKVIAFAGIALSGTQRKPLWACKCLRCGNPEFKIVRGNDLVSGRTVSCGCFHRDNARQVGQRNRRHGHRAGAKASLTYNSWQAMKSRCRNPNSISYPRYGGRGITVAPEFDTFEGFLAAVNERPGRDWSIGRKNNNSGYSPLNCSWETAAMQAHNRRPPVRTKKTANGEVLPPRKPVRSVEAVSTSKTNTN